MGRDLGNYVIAVAVVAMQRSRQVIADAVRCIPESERVLDADLDAITTVRELAGHLVARKIQVVADCQHLAGATHSDRTLSLRSLLVTDRQPVIEPYPVDLRIAVKVDHDLSGNMDWRPPKPPIEPSLYARACGTRNSSG